MRTLRINERKFVCITITSNIQLCFIRIGSLSIAAEAVQPESRIVGGFALNITQVPWQVSVQRNNGALHLCGGAIIGKRWVITAAICIRKEPASTTVVKVGAIRAYSNEGRKIKVEKLIVHERYKKEPSDYDFGLIKLATDLEFSNKVQPIALPDNSENNHAPDTYCLISGWGRTSEFGSNSEILLGVTIPIVEQEYCKSVYATYIHKVTPRMICAGYLQGGISCKFQLRSNLDYLNFHKKANEKLLFFLECSFFMRSMLW